MKEEKITKSAEGIDIPVGTVCDRCGNDLSKGDFMHHYPFRKLYIHLCHICNLGLMYGFWRDIVVEQGELKKRYG